MKNPSLTVLLLVVLCAMGFSVHAEKADRNKPIVFEADAMRYDDVKQVTVIEGNIVLTKGSIVIRAAHIEMREDAYGFQFGTIRGLPDKPAFFRQKREAMDEFVEGESDLIEYDGRADAVKFVKNAVLRRLRGAVLADEITGEQIVYENLTDTFTVEGGAAKGTAPKGRVRAMMTPKPEAAASAVKAASPVQPGPDLRSSQTLGSGAK